MSESSSTNPLREAIRLGLGGAKANIRPGSILWLIGVALVISYYRSPSVSEFLDRIGEFKVAHSPWFSIISTALFGSLIPWLAQAVFLPAERRQPFPLGSLPRDSSNRHWLPFHRKQSLHRKSSFGSRSEVLPLTHDSTHDRELDRLGAFGHHDLSLSPPPSTPLDEYHPHPVVSHRHLFH